MKKKTKILGPWTLPWALLGHVALLPLPGQAQESGSSRGFNIPARTQQREVERWSFANYLTGRDKMRAIDVLYRFYTSPGEKPQPRLEWDATVWGRLLQGTVAEGLENSWGYTMRLHANNFVSGGLGIPTLNIVPGVVGERGEFRAQQGALESLFWGASVRVWGKNPQDSALLFEGGPLRKRLPSGEWNAPWARVSGTVHLLPGLGIMGKWGKEAGALRRDWSRAGTTAEESSWGGCLELGTLRLSLLKTRSHWALPSAIDTGVALPGQGPWDVETLEAGLGFYF